MKDNVVKNKSFAFALRIVNAYKFLAENKKEYVLSKQMLRSGTAVGAMIWEAEHAESKKDFVHKLAIALKEANETEYWILLLKESGFMEKRDGDSLLNNAVEVKKLLVAIVKTTKQTMNN